MRVGRTVVNYGPGLGTITRDIWLISRPMLVLTPVMDRGLEPMTCRLRTADELEPCATEQILHDISAPALGDSPKDDDHRRSS